MWLHLSQGFWGMRGVPGQPDPLRHNTRWRFFAPVGNSPPNTK